MTLARYDSYTDEELFIKLRAGQEDIRDYLMEKYKNLVRKRARAMYLLGGDNDDLIQEGMIGLYKAIRDFDMSKGSSFYSFADLCINRQLYTAVEASQRQKHIPLNSYVSIYDKEHNENKNHAIETNSLYDRIKDPEELLIAEEDRSIMEKEIDKRLSKMERQVLNHYLSGMNYAQIAEIMEKNSKTIDNALQRIKKKVKQIIETKMD